ncbi:PH domain-containing protein [Nocardioides sp. zg-536]|uniref:PH domain-containing protein n=2 Tax=Nocardioides faecalis TaxID=2803858 RepID=A0A939BXZ2_9ACTN|nr:PH domain-containing protein [Nocardioides faecalis]MBS4751611.1 PH domain-containing protein [Nocardioides faecalis]QVI60455.1 PH domain-containing protein [Nocardioides faecalis]
MWQVEAGLEAVAFAVAGTVAALVWTPAPLRWWLVALAVLVPAALAVVVPPWRFRVHRWEVVAEAVYTQRGWWARERRIAPLSRVQTVDIAEPPLARLFGLATVTVTTASAAGALRIDGLDRPLAVALADDLTRRANAVAGDAT